METLVEIKKVLIVDDAPVVRNAIQRALDKKGIATTLAASGNDAIKIMDNQSFDLALVDIRMPGMNGVLLLKKIRAKYPETSVIMITGYPTIESAVHCTKLGAVDYLVKPFKIDELNTILDKLKHCHAVLSKKDTLDVNSLKVASDEDVIIGQSRPMKQVFEKIRKVAPTDSTVLITGESGTGKELVARAIYTNSNRKDNEFVAVDCSSLVETLLESELFGHVKGSFTGAHQTKHGLFELANKGTFFFDEIGNLSKNIQAKLLRVIQEREFMKVGDQNKIKLNIRIVSASNQDLKKLISSGEFRDDLYYRLSVVPLKIPALRNRKEDIPALVDHFIKKFSKKIKRNTPEISIEAMQALKEYSWPGNVRELEHTIERVLILEEVDLIRVRNLPSLIAQRQADVQMFSEEPLTLKELEKQYIKLVLRRTKGKKAQAADILGINRKTLGMKIKKYELYL
jgi:DNA-binding NtrC family response regulator